jgi:anaerobic ribonucleoside-triphosphate reductase activating protein
MSAAELRVSRLHYPVTVLGPGRRLGIWVQGCPLACRGCVSRDTWDPAAGHAVGVDVLAACWWQAVADGAEGLTISGGEPLAQPSAMAALLAAADQVRRKVHGRTGPPDILVYTGYELAELDPVQQAALEHVDAVITGRYDITRPTDLIWRGSANQQLLPRTELGRQRYARYVEHSPERSGMQLTVRDGALWFIGVPRRRDMTRLEQTLRDHGVTIGRVTWRP